MRKSFDTLSAYVSTHFEMDAYSGAVFVFIGKSRNRMKVLVWEDSGFWLCAKRLEMGTFNLPKFSDDGKVHLSPADFQLLLEGVVILKSRRLKRYKKV
jgi:transposase